MRDHSWQLSNLELSKRLKELGVKQESLWWWVLVGKLEKEQYELMCSGSYIALKYDYSAFTVAELDDKLSKVRYKAFGVETYMIFYNSIDNTWHCCFRNPPLEWIDNGSQEAGRDKNPANCRAKMLIYLEEKKLI